MTKQTVHIVGIMSGSSLDALDLALVRFTVEDARITEWALSASAAIPLTGYWKSRLAQLAEADVRELQQADADLGKWIGMQCAGFIRMQAVVPDAIASHGHTVLHHPEEGVTVQIGNPSEIAGYVQCDVITGFRSADVAAGGQGAPLAPVVERHLFPGYGFYLNLGGIANLSVFGDTGVIRAWDIVPCNQLLNGLASALGMQFDDRGSLARKGKVDKSLLDQLITTVELPVLHPFSLDNAWVGEYCFPLIHSHGLSVPDQLATAVEWIAQGIALQTSHFMSTAREQKMMITGGGAYNTYLVERISHHVKPVGTVIPNSEIVDFKEAILIALCGLLRLLGLPNAFASVTGATHDTVNGDITAAGLHAG